MPSWPDRNLVPDPQRRYNSGMKPGLPLSLSIAGLPRIEDAPPEPRSLIEWAARLGFRCIQLDAAMPGVRPRDLDRSARRDLAALLRRLELGLSGLDLWIPPAHFTDPARAERAIEAAEQAVDLAAAIAQLGAAAPTRPALAITLPAAVPQEVGQRLSTAAGAAGIRIADHAWPLRPFEAGAPLGPGLDPAAVVLAGEDPARVAAGLPGPPVSARLDDLSSAGRVPPGEGALDELAYLVALEVKGYRAPVVLDLRALPAPRRTAQEVLERWTGFGVPG